MTSTVSASGSDSIYQWFPKQLEAMGSAEILKSHSRNTEYTIHHNNYQIIPNPKDLLPMSNFFVPREMIVWWYKLSSLLLLQENITTCYYHMTQVNISRKDTCHSGTSEVCLKCHTTIRAFERWFYMILLAFLRCSVEPAENDKVWHKMWQSTTQQMNGTITYLCSLSLSFCIYIYNLGHNIEKMTKWEMNVHDHHHHHHHHHHPSLDIFEYTIISIDCRSICDYLVELQKDGALPAMHAAPNHCKMVARKKTGAAQEMQLVRSDPWAKGRSKNIIYPRIYIYI